MNSDIFDEAGGFEPYRYKRTRERKPYMGMGPRERHPDVRDKIGKIVKPMSYIPKMKRVGPPSVGNSCGVAKDTMPVKQEKSTAKKYSGPNYPQKAPGIKPFGGK